MYSHEEKMELFREIADKPIWVAVKGNSYFAYYIRVMCVYERPDSIDEILVKRFPGWWTSYIHNTANNSDLEPEDYEIIDDTLVGLSKPHIHEVDFYEICEPLELLTTNEMRDILESLPIIGEDV